MANHGISAPFGVACAFAVLGILPGLALAEEIVVAQALPEPSPAQIQQALRYGDQFQAQMPSRVPRYTTPPMAIPPEYTNVPTPAYCARYPYAPYCIPPVIIPRYSPSPVWKWPRWHYDEATGWEIK
ncbi:MAG: hypothetical protein ABW131_09115 [Candidatus Sedimenticola sp. 6PFRAG5]